MLGGLFTRRKPQPAGRTERAVEDYAAAVPTRANGDPLENALQQGRLGVLVWEREQFRSRPGFDRILQRTLEAIDQRFAVVPEGIASIALSVFDAPGSPERDVETGPFLLARHCVTNLDYQSFVDAGGYQNMELWPEEIWPHLINFVDQAGRPGPRFWRDGVHDQRRAREPVVGINYYEASAYARWAGYRLPAEAEWQMAASWRIRSEAHAGQRYPWGDGLDLRCCNIWCTGNGALVPVDACPEGAAPNGVLQLIGNVWEWTSDDFESTDREGRRVVGNTLMKSVRGGSFDTYFAWQATASFRTGVEALTRAHNVGLRCAMDLLPE